MCLSADRDQGVFWAGIAPCEHVVQFYEADAVFLDTLEGFVFGGLNGGEGVIVIATPEHIETLETRMSRRGVDLGAARAWGQYIRLETDAALARFMVDGWPDEVLFEAFVTETLELAGKMGRRVRAFGEMVAVLWARGNAGATVHFEHIWQRLCRERRFSLFCAYPRIEFTADADESMREICRAHSRVLQ